VPDDPVWPGVTLPSYQPARLWLLSGGTWMLPLLASPSRMTGASTSIAGISIAGAGTAWPVTSTVSPTAGVLDWLAQLSTTGGVPDGPYRLNVNDFGTRMLSVPGSVKASWPVTVNVELVTSVVRRDSLTLPG
jgi:hypothetical protein